MAQIRQNRIDTKFPKLAKVHTLKLYDLSQLQKVLNYLTKMRRIYIRFNKTFLPCMELHEKVAHGIYMSQLLFTEQLGELLFRF